jgi:hypothetical protein
VCIQKTAANCNAYGTWQGRNAALLTSSEREGEERRGRERAREVVAAATVVKMRTCRVDLHMGRVAPPPRIHSSALLLLPLPPASSILTWTTQAFPHHHGYCSLNGEDHHSPTSRLLLSSILSRSDPFYPCCIPVFCLFSKFSPFHPITAEFGLQFDVVILQYRYCQ